MKSHLIRRIIGLEKRLPIEITEPNRGDAACEHPLRLLAPAVGPPFAVAGNSLLEPKALTSGYGTPNNCDQHRRCDRFTEVREYLDGFQNLHLLGRNGMHRYNNQDHSMLTAMVAVDNTIAGRTDKPTIWEVNTEMEYNEEAAGQAKK
jgi:hypothetical protein